MVSLVIRHKFYGLTYSLSLNFGIAYKISS